jgi:hypothetical protein
MTCAYHVNPEHQLVIFRPTGQFTETTFIDLCRAAYTDPTREPHFAHVWDTRNIDELVMDVDVIPMYRTLLEEHQNQITEGKVAIVTTRIVTQTFASMLIQVDHRGPATFQLFEAMEAAAEWVGLPMQALEDIPESQWTVP